MPVEEETAGTDDALVASPGCLRADFRQRVSWYTWLYLVWIFHEECVNNLGCPHNLFAMFTFAVAAQEELVQKLIGFYRAAREFLQDNVTLDSLPLHLHSSFSALVPVEDIFLEVSETAETNIENVDVAAEFCAACLCGDFPDVPPHLLMPTFQHYFSLNNDAIRQRTEMFLLRTKIEFAFENAVQVLLYTNPQIVVHEFPQVPASENSLVTLAA